MIYVKALDALQRKLDETFGLINGTDTPLESADCAVIEIPRFTDVLGKLPAGMPILVIVNGMTSLADNRAVRRAGAKIVKEEDLAAEIQGLRKENKPENQPGDLEDDFDEDDVIMLDEEETVKTEPLKPLRPEPRVETPSVQHAARRQERQIPEKPRAPQHEEPEEVKVPILRLKPVINKDNPDTNKDTYEPVYEKPVQEEIRERPRRQILNPRTTRGIIVASYSSSGGVGKTFMACNVSALCATQNVSTVLVDLDLGFGNIDIETGLVDEVERDRVIDKRTMPKSNWATVTDWRKHAIDLKANTLRHNSGLYVVPSFPYAGKELPEAEIEDLLHTLSEMYDLVVVDLGVDGFSNQARVALRMSNAIMIVAGQDPKTIGKLTHFLNQEGGKNDKMHLVFNMRKPTGYYNPKEVAKKMMFEKYYSVPLDEEGVNAARVHHKLVVQIPGSIAGEAVKNFSAAVLPFNIDAGEIVRPKKINANIGFFTKMISKFKRA